MAKYCGKIGFVISKETESGTWEYETVEKIYRGDVIRNTRRWEGREELLDNVNIRNSISILAKDSFCIDNCSAIRYAWWKGAKWKVIDMDISYPRIVLTLGGVYNGPEAETET